MAAHGRQPISLSGVPLVFDRFGMIGPYGDGIVDPLSAVRGLSRGLGLAMLLWVGIGVAIGLI